jgi:hypothetical protein
MFNGKYKSIYTVIENILRDTDYYNEIKIEDATEWAARAMELIGAPLIKEESISTITVANYRASLPDEVISIKGVRDNETGVPLIAATDEFITANYTESLEDDDFGDGISFGNYSIRTASYKVMNGYLFFNVKEGDIDILYTKFPTDDNGCLLIPAVDRYLMAIESYIIFKLDSKLYRRGVIAKNIKDESEQNWLWYVSSAHTKIVTPNYDEAESLKNQIQKMRTDKDAHAYGFKYLNVPTVKKF